MFLLFSYKQILYNLIWGVFISLEMLHFLLSSAALCVCVSDFAQI